MFIYYTPVFAIGGFRHDVGVYPKYTKEMGLEGDAQHFRASNKALILKELRKLKLPKIQIKHVDNMMKNKMGGVIDASGTFVGLC